MSTDPNADANAKTEKATKETQRILDVIASGNQLLLKSCREAFRALNVTSGAAVQNAAPIASANFALVPSAEDGSMILLRNNHSMAKAMLMPPLLVRRVNVVRWPLEAACEHINFLRWYRYHEARGLPPLQALPGFGWVDALQMSFKTASSQGIHHEQSTHQARKRACGDAGAAQEQHKRDSLHGA
ncbi:hypothetical protein PI125_g16426 [Phytophthora idaei]|nr:hypothetical protein PI125_g16426 [Phytophthora idaei]